MSRAWAPLPVGAFTGFDWSAPGATAGWDPYLVWAEATRFASQGGLTPTWLTLAVELQPGTSVRDFVDAGHARWMRVPSAYLESTPEGSRFCTARVRPHFFAALAPGGALHGRVKRIEIGLAVHEPDDGESAATDAAAPPAAAGMSAAHARPTPVAGKVLAIIDDSLAVAHANLLAGNTPRTAFLWRQDSRGGGRRPADLGYGHEVTAAMIASALDAFRDGELVDEGAVYTALGLSVIGQRWPHGQVPFHALDVAASHGSHVADLAAGPRTAQARTANLPPDLDAPPSWTRADDAASRCPMVAVQLDTRTVADTSGGAMNVAVLDAMAYILARCEPDAHVVVNLSYGSLAGPHDGTSLLERAMDGWIALCGGRLQVVVAAGNSYQLRTHANLPLASGAEQVLHWRVPPDDRTPSFLELWIAPGGSGIAIEITPPAGASLPALPVGASGQWLDPRTGQPMATLVYPSSVATGEQGTCVLLAIAPTFSFDAAACTAPSGVWRVRLANRGAESTVVDAYIERDDVIPGRRNGARQSHFEDDPELHPSQQYDLDAEVDDPARSTPIRRSGSFNSIATGRGTVSVGGGVLAEPQAWARYSPRRPDPDAQRPRRPGVVKLPDQVRPSDESRAVGGILAMGSRSGLVVRMAGTSSAAPQAARDLLNQASTSGTAASS